MQSKSAVMDTNKFSNFVKGCLKVIELNHAEQLEPFIIIQFNVLLQTEFELKNKADSFRQVELLVKRLFKKYQTDPGHQSFCGRGYRRKHSSCRSRSANGRIMLASAGINLTQIVTIRLPLLK